MLLFGTQSRFSVTILGRISLDWSHFLLQFGIYYLAVFMYALYSFIFTQQKYGFWLQKKKK